MNIITAIYTKITEYKKAKANALVKQANKSITAAKQKQIKAQNKVAKINKKIEKLQEKANLIKSESNIAVENAQKLKTKANVATIKAQISNGNLEAYKELNGFEKVVGLAIIALEILTGNTKQKEYIKNQLEKKAENKGQKVENKAQNQTEKKSEKAENKTENKAETEVECKPIAGIQDGKKGYFYTNKKGEKKFYEAQFSKKLGLYGCYIGSKFYEYSKEAA